MSEIVLHELDKLSHREDGSGKGAVMAREQAELLKKLHIPDRPKYPQFFEDADALWVPHTTLSSLLSRAGRRALHRRPSIEEALPPDSIEAALQGSALHCTALLLLAWRGSCPQCLHVNSLLSPPPLFRETGLLLGKEWRRAAARCL